MDSNNLKHLNIEKSVKEKLEKEKFYYVKDVLSRDKFELVKLLGMNLKKTEELIATISKTCISSPHSVYKMYEHKRKQQLNGFLPTSLHSLDAVLQGGISLSNITEITGPPGVGKTQFCFMLSIIAVLPFSLGGLEGQVIYIDTEFTFTAKRVKEIAASRFPSLNEFQLSKVLESIQVYQVSTSQDLKQIVSDLDKEIVTKNIKLIIVDSPASLVRKEYGSGNVSVIAKRNDLILQIAATLKKLADVFGIAVFITNQITTHIMNKHVKHSSDEEEDKVMHSCSENPPPVAVPRKKRRSHVIQPALGTAWAHCVNSRLVAEFCGPALRQISVVKSPLAPNVTIRYTIEKSGICVTDEDVRFLEVSNPDVRTIRTRYDFM